MNKNAERTLRARFDHWIGGGIFIQYHHGWNKSEFKGKYTKCYVFKCNEKRLEHRFYGFLCNPKLSARRYQVCVLANHAEKKTWKTDENDLKTTETIRTTLAVQKAIENYFKE